ncbi:hypothetical protein [Actinomadura sp. NPDC049753]|uniref:hypothetical protein n=1 Tax=Actinomadura sp. NPDC049753 TaxID=3154739 RepID=UPI003412B881
MKPRESVAAAAFGALLDRSVAQIEAVATDGRMFDREAVRWVSDVWDNNTFALFRVAVARTRWSRERRARVALAWMADFGAERRAWMVQQAGSAGHRLEPLLPAPGPETVPGRDYRGVMRPRRVPLTEDSAAELAADYDLAGAQVRTFQVERAGDRLVGFVEAVAARRFPIGSDDAGPAELEMWLDDVTEARFDAGDRSPVTVCAGPDRIVVGLGGDGVIRAKSGSVYCDDSYWHLSGAGLTADRRTPPLGERPAWPDPLRRPERLDGAALAAATLLRGVMWDIRTVRYVHRVGVVPIAPLCRVLAGAGTQVLAAGRRGGARRREEAFRRLVEEWLDCAGPALHHRLWPWLGRVADGPHIGESTRSWLAALAPQRPRSSRPESAPGLEPPSEAELRLASYTAAHTRHGREREASSVLNLAVPLHPEAAPDEPWMLRTLKIGDTGRFRLHSSAFDGPHHPQTVIDQDVVHSFTLPDEALTVRRARPGPSGA